MTCEFTTQLYSVAEQKGFKIHGSLLDLLNNQNLKLPKAHYVELIHPTKYDYCSSVFAAWYVDKEPLLAVVFSEIGVSVNGVWFKPSNWEDLLNYLNTFAVLF